MHVPRERFHDEREPPLRIGDVVRLNSGGPPCLIVDFPSSETVTISWLNGEGFAKETVLPSECVHRIRLVG